MADAPKRLVRLAVPDRPGGLALVTRCLASCGVDILAVEVVGHLDGDAVDDLLVRGGDLERALAALEGEVRLVGSRAVEAMPDPGIAMAEAFARTFRARDASTARDALVASLLAMVGADAGSLLVTSDGQRLEPLASSPGGLPQIAPDEPTLARRVLRRSAPLLCAADGAWAPLEWRTRIAARQLALVPVERGRSLLLLARVDDFPFVDAEAERARAFARAAGAALG